jgi:ABC-type branched-subunit amino acid transport system ATPase component
LAKISDDILSVSGLGAGYGQIRVIRDATMSVRRGEVVGLVGRNGAGKTTYISALAGLLAATGSVLLEGAEVGGLPAHKRVAARMALVPSGGRLFRSLTVEENLTIGIVKPSAEDFEYAYKLFPELLPIRARFAGKLSGGERQMVAIGRALMLRPRLLLLDEPSEGLAPLIVLRLAHAIKELRASGVSILVAEQNIRFTDLICQRWYSIDKGNIAPFEHLTPPVKEAAAVALPSAQTTR